MTAASQYAISWDQYKAHLPTHILQSAVSMGGSCFIMSLVAGTILSSRNPVSLAFASGAFSMIATLIDSAIRPLLHLWKIGHVDGNERFFDWAGRRLVVMSLTAWVLSHSLPLMGIRISSWCIQKMMISSAAMHFVDQYLRRGPTAKLASGPNEARYYANIVA